MNDALAEEQLRRYEEQKGKRKNFESDWQYISQYFIPQDSVIVSTKTEGVQGFTDLVFETTGIQAAQTLAAGQNAYVTPGNQPWAEYEPPEDLGDEDKDEAKLWLGHASDVAMREISRSNFYQMVALSHLGRPVFGTDLMLADEGSANPLLFNHCRINTYTIAENDEGIVDECRREIELTGRQAKQKFSPSTRFPKQGLPEKMLKQLEGAKGMDKKFKFLHCIFPRMDSGKLDGRRDDHHPKKEFASVYVSIDYRECVRVSGYDENPILCTRFAKWGTDSVWGYGPGYLALPEARQINYMQQWMDAMAELHANPRVLIPSNLDGDVDLRAGGATVFDINKGEAGIPREWGTVADYKLGMDLMDRKREAINQAFFVPAFRLLNSQPLIDKQMTAYEISQRLAEQLEGFTPVMSRLTSELIQPLMLRVFGILYRAGKFGQAPQSLIRKVGRVKGLANPNVAVTSRLAGALKALKNRGAQDALAFALNIAETAQRPDVLDVFDLDKTVSDYAINTSMPADNLRKAKGPNSIQAIRQKRQQQQQAQQAAELAEKLGKAGKGLEGSPDFIKEPVKQQIEQHTKAA